MKNELKVVGSDYIKVKGVTMTSTSLTIDDGTDFPSWEKIGGFWGHLRASKRWWIGDWINHGEKKFGEKYSQAIEETGYDYSVLAKSAFVCARIAKENRRSALPFEHHAHVAKLEVKDQIFWLDQAEKHCLTHTELAASIKAGSVVRKEQIEKEDGNKSGLLTIDGWIFYADRWMKDQMKQQPINQWGRDRRLLVKEKLKPIVEFWQTL